MTEIVPITKAAELRGVTRRTLDRWREAGELRSYPPPAGSEGRMGRPQVGVDLWEVDLAIRRSSRLGPKIAAMATSKKVASDAGRELKTQTSKKEKEVAASALAQTPRKATPAKKKTK